MASSQNMDVDIEISDDEADEKLNWNDCRMIRMPFGKHRGKTFAQMISTKETRRYLYWLREKMAENKQQHSPAQRDTFRTIETGIDFYEVVKAQRQGTKRKLQAGGDDQRAPPTAKSRY